MSPTPQGTDAPAAGVPERHPGLRGDEARLFARYHARLQRATAISVSTSAANVDDACAFAWSQLIARQPRRLSVYGWLRTVARREALRLDKIARRTVELDTEHPAPARATQLQPTGRRSIEHTHGMIEALERLAVLPGEQREPAFLRAVGWRHSDIADFLGLTEARVAKLLRRADAHLRELDQRDRAPTSDRAARLRELEDDPPVFLLRMIGQPPRPNRKHREQLRREWRRLALAIDDYRIAHQITDPCRAFGPRPDALDAPRCEDFALDQRIGDYRLARSVDLGREI